MTTPVEPDAPAPADDWPQLSRLLDEALALPVEARATWLAGLRGDAARLGPRLAALLAHEADAERRGFLAQPAQFTLPPSAGDADAEDPVEAGRNAAGDAVGPWTLLSPLGRGGMAEVWRARRSDGSLQRSVALKLPLPGFADARMAARVLRERHLLASLAHPNIVRLFDAGATTDGRPWLAMEAVDGLPITQWCSERGASLAQKIALLLQACDAVQHAHGRLVVHRDIKPSNMLVSADGCVHLLDFGIAKLLQVEGSPNEGTEADASLTQLGGRPLTPDYASPEQIAGEEPGIATDVYALGVLAYRLFAGVAPHEPADASRRALEAAIAEQAPRPPSVRVADAALRRALHGDLDTIVLKALKKLPAERYATVDAFAADLRRHLAGEPVQARPDTWAYRASRFVRRNRWAVAGAAVVATSLAGGIGVAVVQARQARAETVRAQAMYEFMRGLLNPDDVANPGTANRDRTVRDLVVDAARRIPQALPDAPVQRFSLMQDIAPLVRSLGSNDDGVALLQANLEQAKALFGESSVEYAKPLLALSEMKDLHAGDYAGGLQNAQRALDIFEKARLSDARLLASAHSMVGFFGTQVHPQGEAADIAHIERAAALLRALPGQPELAGVLQMLANSYGEAGREEQALKTALEAVDVNRRATGAVSALTAASLEQASIWARTSGQRALADRLIREAGEINGKVWPADHFRVALWSKYFSDINLLGANRAEAQGALQLGEAIMRLPKWKGNVAVRQLVEESLLNFDLRSGRLREARERCAAMRAEWPRAGVSSRMVASARCGFTAAAVGDMASAVGYLGDAHAAVQAMSPGRPDVYPLPALLEGEIALAEKQMERAAARFIHVLDSCAADDYVARTNAWLGLSIARPLDDRLVLGHGLPAALAQISKLDTGYFIDLEAALREATGRASLARGKGREATDELQRAVSLRERIDTPAVDPWLARALESLAQAQALNGESALSANTLRRAERIRSAQPSK